MKVCEDCGQEIGTRDGESACARCDAIRDYDNRANPQIRRERKIARSNRRAREQVMEDLGLVKVKGALGGTYWE